MWKQISMLTENALAAEVYICVSMVRDPCTFKHISRHVTMAQLVFTISTVGQMDHQVSLWKYRCSHWSQIVLKPRQ